MTEFTPQQKLDAIQRELDFRQRVYARRIQQGQMTHKKADYEIGVMRAIHADYFRMMEAEKLI